MPLLGGPFLSAPLLGDVTAATPSHAATGALAASAATIAGTAAHKTLHTSTGALVASAATIAGTAVHKTLHTSTGALTASAAAIAGTAAHQHAATGALAASAATIAGTAAHKTLHTSTGALAASAATIAGTANRVTAHAATGALAAGAATIAGTAAHSVLHAATGALVAASAAISGVAAHNVTHNAIGALAADAATISGTAINGNAPHVIPDGWIMAQEGAKKKKHKKIREDKALLRQQIEEAFDPPVAEPIADIPAVSNTKTAPTPTDITARLIDTQRPVLNVLPEIPALIPLQTPQNGLSDHEHQHLALAQLIQSDKDRRQSLSKAITQLLPVLHSFLADDGE